MGREVCFREQKESEKIMAGTVLEDTFQNLHANDPNKLDVERFITMNCIIYVCKLIMQLLN